jgi:hypothetical protein
MVPQMMPQQYVMPSMPLAAQGPCATCPTTVMPQAMTQPMYYQAQPYAAQPNYYAEPSCGISSYMMESGCGAPFPETVGYGPEMMMGCDPCMGGCMDGCMSGMCEAPFTAPSPETYVAPGPAAE